MQVLKGMLATWFKSGNGGGWGPRVAVKRVQDVLTAKPDKGALPIQWRPTDPRTRVAVIVGRKRG